MTVTILNAVVGVLSVLLAVYYRSLYQEHLEVNRRLVMAVIDKDRMIVALRKKLAAKRSDDGIS